MPRVRVPAGPLDYGCVLIPLGSPRPCSKRSYVHVPVSPRVVVQRPCSGVWGPGGYRGGYTGWVYRVGNTRVPSQLESGGHIQRSGPRKPCKGWSGWDMSAAPARAPRTHPSGPVGPLQGPPWFWGPLPASWPIRARFDLISTKVSQNDEVSPKKCHKACHSPYSQNGSRKSPLEIPRFPF